MKSILFILSLLTVIPLAHANDSIGQVLLSEYMGLRATASTLAPDFDLGGYSAKDYGDYKLRIGRIEFRAPRSSRE
ncbi:MAG: hypothetical protein AB7G93_01035 [Bdellovibrionales bacterium]